MTHPLVSVIIPVFNGDRFISQAIESVLRQTYSKFEIIVVNDGSTDQTAQVLTPYLHLIRYFIQPNQGAASARNRGLATATGELIAFLDADDFFFPLSWKTRLLYLNMIHR
jgi:glycosyltransferase involved in cell wall biosynthesis